MTRKIAPSLLIIALLSIFALSLGSSEISGLWRYIFNPQFDPTSLAHQIIWDIRAPRIAAALLVGASLGVAGAIAQAATNNPLAEPAILGTSAGAALGVLIGVLSNLVEVGSIGAILFVAIGAACEISPDSCHHRYWCLCDYICARRSCADCSRTP